MRKVYKIVYAGEDGNLESYMASGEANVYYTIGEPATAPEWLAEIGYHLLAFTSKRAARESKLYGHLYLAEAKVINALPPMLDLSLLQRRDISVVRGEWPEGTIMCTEITLLKYLGLNP